MPAQPYVSVAIPVYNGEQYLTEAIGSVLAQTHPPYEFRILDNGSTDASAAVALAALPRSSVSTRPENVGAVRNFNECVTGSDPATKYFMWLADDDRLDPRFVERCVATLEQNPTAPACLTGVRFIDLDGQAVGLQQDPDLASPTPRIRLRSFLRRPRWTEFYCLYRRDALLNSPMMTPEYGTDVFLTWWFLLRSPLAVITDPLLDYRLFPDKSVDEMASSLNPDEPREHARKARMWRRLWTMTRDPEVPLAAARTARRELLLAAIHPTWLTHFAEDVFERWPRVRHLARLAVLRVRR